ncbi:MAG: metal ABC transporter ATP-binding protein [Minisyncoccota bacterium]
MHDIDHSENIIEIKDLSFSYDNDEVLCDINLTVHRGDYLCVVGGNGSGKTTLIKMMLGLLAPQAGSVKLFGRDISVFNDWQKIGYVPQKVTNFDINFPATVAEVVLMGRYGRRGIFRRMTATDRMHAKRALEQVDMGEKADRLIGDLSGGQQQRVFIARALATEPEMILLDEPTVGVAKDIRDDFYRLIKKLNEEMNLTVILVTHDLESIGRGAMHVAEINRGITFYESVEEFLAHLRTRARAHHYHA